MTESLKHKQVCFLSMDSLDDFVDDDDKAVDELHRHGCQVEYVDWQAPNSDWSRFDLVVIRSTWNYQNFRDDFLHVLSQIEESNTLLINPLEIIQWNIDKKYLLELKELGISIVPTIQFDRWLDPEVNLAIDKLDCEKFVIKPRISANADDTYLIATPHWNADSELQSTVANKFADRGLILQPFVESVATQGEFSVFYIGDEFTHAISKKPKQGDFRVQEEHGGIIEAVDLSPFVATGKEVIEKLRFVPYYARLDFIEYDGKLCVMEIEMIEPSLYFRFGERAITKFSETVSNCLASID